MEGIREAIEYCGLGDYKKRIESNRREMQLLKKAMSDLSICHSVSTYKYCADLDMQYRRKKLLTTEDKTQFYDNQMFMQALMHDDNVKLYVAAYDKYMELERECHSFYKRINLDFRRELEFCDLPNIFVYQGMIDMSKKLKLSRHIIISEMTDQYIDTPNTVIYPEEILTSKRKLRHFYNDVSYRYLEQLIQDEDFDVKVKKLGRVIIK